jgi:hypothetical protein
MDQSNGKLVQMGFCATMLFFKIVPDLSYTLYVSSQCLLLAAPTAAHSTVIFSHFQGFNLTCPNIKEMFHWWAQFFLYLLLLL